jgi:hypothetical protein
MAVSTDEINGGNHDWVDLEAIFLTRTIHVHSLSPLHLPVSSAAQAASKELTQRELDAFAQGLKSHLNARFNQPSLSATLGGSTRTDGVQLVRATFLRSSQLDAKGTPKPFAVEVQVKQPSPIASNPNRSRLETAHLLFFSTPSRQTRNHYPVLLWKPLLSARVAPSDQRNADIDAEAARIAVDARLLTSQTLYFVAAYFDCRISPLAPLHGIRGKNLEDIAEGVAAHARKQSNHLAMELTFALPDRVDSFNDGNTVEGPAPGLNTISLSIPGAVMEELLSDTPPNTPLMPAVHRYLSMHTSIPLARLTLIRVGVANVYIGTPTSIVTPAGRASTDEVRLKITRDASNESQRRLVETVISQVVRAAAEEGW